jgi:hypothetical protein
MTEKKFYLESPTKPLQEIGMRAQVISFLIANGIKDGNALNDSANSKRVIVAVRADDEKKIKEIKDELVRHLNKLHANDFCYSEFPHDIQAGELMELTNPQPVVILSLNELANSLMLEQTSKGVGAMRYLANALRPLPGILEKLTNKLK